MHKRDLEQILALLGDTAEAVAQTLQDNGIKGVRNTVRYLNPVVRFAQVHLRMDDFGLDLMQRELARPYTLRLTLPNGSSQEAELPAPVKEFLEAFNGGVYPDLELPPGSL